MSPHRPTFEEFVRLTHEALKDGKAPFIPVYRQLVGDGLTPVSAFQRIAEPGPSFLFESVVGGEKIGRYSFLGTRPHMTYEARGRDVTVRSPNLIHQAPTTFTSDDPFEGLESRLKLCESVQLPGLPRFVGGAVGFAAYDSVRYLERLPNAPPDDRGLPDLSFAFYDRMVIFDHIRKTILVVSHARTDALIFAPYTGVDFDPKDLLRQIYDGACSEVDETVAQLARPEPPPTIRDVDLAAPTTLEPASNMTQPQFEAVVRRCQEYIKAGDIFQVVPSQRFTLETTAKPFDIYRTLRVVNPSPFLFYLAFDDFHLVGSSPEILVRVENGDVTVRPLAGTRRRGKDEAEDRALAAELLADPKERAEHIMLVDLGRNDVGRVCEYDSVRLTDLMTVERYSHVMHITSNVTGKLSPGKTAFDALRAGLPAGTVSGAPKVRAMEVIDEVEPHRRGPYAGAVGYFDYAGNMDTCIALRTLVLKGTTAYIQAGAGIVYDSDPATEYEETVNKARGLLKAIEIAQTQL
jgi:anthranilate synthase component 1